MIIGWKRVIGKKGMEVEKVMSPSQRRTNMKFDRSDLKIFFLKSRKHCRAKIVKIESSLFFSSQ